MSKKIGEITLRSDQKVEWRIGNFSSLTKGYVCFYSPEFIISDTKFYLMIYPNGQTTRNGWISVYLNCLSLVGVRCCFGVKKVDGIEVQNRSHITWVFQNDNYQCGFHKFMERSELLRRSDLMSYDTLTLICNLWIQKDLKLPIHLDSLSRNLADLLTVKSSSDVTLVVQGKEFAVHRSILSARSSVFARMFENEMAEKRTGIVNISDCDPDSFGAFLNYLYSGKIEMVSINAMEMYKIADKYDVQELKSLCCMSIISRLLPENVLDALLFGEKYNEIGLKQKAEMFFIKHYKPVILTAQWDKFLKENMELANDLLKDMAKGTHQH